MTMVDWLVTEQLVEIFRDARSERPGLNAELVVEAEHAEPGRLAGAGTSVRIDTTSGGVLLVTPKRIVRLTGDLSSDLVSYDSLVGYDWISPDVTKKVALKDAHYDRLYLYSRNAPPVVLDHLGPAVYPLMKFLGRVLEYRSQKVLLRKLDPDVIDVLGRCLRATVGTSLFTDDDLRRLFRRDRVTLELLSGMWPQMNLASPDLLDLLQCIVRQLTLRTERDPELLRRETGADATRLKAALEVFRRVVTGEV